MKPILNIENLTKIYGNVPSQTKALNGITFQVMPGEFLGIMGSSGSGKSTLMKLLLHLMPCDSGKLYFETECGKVEIDAGTRTVFSYVPQGNMIMSGTIRENITFCNPKVTDEEIQRAARAACIWDYIETLPNGLDTVLSERGEGLSMGQIQRIAIARAILDDAPILLLDECTALHLWIKRQNGMYCRI